MSEPDERPDGYVPVQQRVLELLRESSGAINDPFDAAARIAYALDVSVERGVAALNALDKRGFITREGKRNVALTEIGWTNDVAAPAPDDHPAVHTQGTPERTEPTATTPLSVVPAPAQHEVSKGVPTKEKVMGKDAAHVVLAHIRSKGGVIRNERGLCSADIREATGTDPKDVLGSLDAEGLIRREIRGKRTFSIELTPRGIEAARNGKAATNGDVQELRSGDRLVDDGERKVRPARRKAGAPSGPATPVRRGRAAGARKRAPSGRRGRAHGDGARVDEPLRDLPGPRPASEVDAELDAVRNIADSLKVLTPPSPYPRRRVHLQLVPGGR